MNIEDLSLEDLKKTKNLIKKFYNVGFQATKVAQAVEIIKKMQEERATIFLTFTANMVASGLRGLFAELCKHKFPSVIITTPGALEHDFIKSFSNYYLGEFETNDIQLHREQINRIGNIYIKTENYVLFEKNIKKVLENLYSKKIVSPSEIAREIGLYLRDKNSFLFWCAKNNIPIFCPGITDGALGLQIYFFKQKYQDFIVDVTKDMKELANLTLNAKTTGGIILGGGISKHHAIGVNILRGGFDYAVYITTAQPWDGSLSGARSSEAISWGKISERARHVTIDGEATIVFPLIIAALEIC